MWKLIDFQTTSVDREITDFVARQYQEANVESHAQHWEGCRYIKKVEAMLISPNSDIGIIIKTTEIVSKPSGHVALATTSSTLLGNFNLVPPKNKDSFWTIENFFLDN